MSVWLFIGSSASAPYGLAAAREVLTERHTVITCNAGIRLEPRPDYYFCWDYNAALTFEIFARDALAAGCHLITLDRPEGDLRTHHVDWYIERVPVGTDEPTQSEWGRFRGSGLVCMEYALRHGCHELHLVGCDGYQHDSPQDYFDGTLSPRLYGRRRNPADMNSEHVEPRTQTLVDGWPGCRWVCWGEPTYQIRGEQWSVRSLPSRR